MRHLHTNISSRVTTAQRQDLLRQKGCVVWFTGLSGSGKSTLAVELESQLMETGHLAFILDGDKVRQGLCRDLNFSDRDRNENIRRVAEAAKLLADSGVIVLTAFISPFRAGRKQAKKIIGGDRLIEIYCAASLEVCEKRDVKGLYAKARNGEVSAFTGVTSPYEAPEEPAWTLDTGSKSVKESVAELWTLLKERSVLL